MVDIPHDAILRFGGKASILHAERLASADPAGLERFARHRLFMQLADVLADKFAEAITTSDETDRRVFEIAIYVLKPDWVKAKTEPKEAAE